MKRQRIVFALVTLGIALSWGCSASSRIEKFDAAKDFPTEQRIVEIKQTPAAEPKFRDGSNEGRVDYWELAGPLPSSWGSQTVRSNSVVAKKIGADFDDAKMTASMSCYAREVGLFYAHYEKYPYIELDTFIRRRCGTVAPFAAVRMMSFEDLDITEQRIVASDGFDDWIDSVTEDDDDFVEYGVWVGSGRKGAFVVVAQGTISARVKSVPINQKPGAKVVIEGKLRDNADYVFGLTTRGKYDYDECVSTQGLEPPAFRVTCTLDGNDPTVNLAISRGREDDVFSTSILDMEFRRNLANPLLFVAHGATVPAPTVAPGGDATAGADGTVGAALPRPKLVQKHLEASNVEAVAFRKRILERTNAVRREAGRKPLSLEAKQSDAVRDLVPYAFAGDDEDKKNEALLGALAGWEVDAQISNGTFVTRTLYNGDVDDFVNGLVATPGGRRVLLDEDIGAIAVGSMFDKSTSTVATVITAYDLLKKEPHKKRVNRFLDKLAKARAARGASPPRKVKNLKPIADSLARRVEKGEIEFHVAAGELWERSMKEYQRPTHIYYGAAHDPLNLSFNEDILTMEPLRIAIMVTPFKPEGSPWYIYGIAVAFPKTKQVTKVAEVEEIDTETVQVEASASAR